MFPPTLIQTYSGITQIFASVSFPRSENMVKVVFWGPATFNTGYLQV